jgi:GntR family transcriptional repressor for pyruvate dehydrogenase complex
VADEVTNLFPLVQEPQAFLVHDVAFHRIVAASSRNPILVALIEMVSALYYERRRKTAERGPARDAPPRRRARALHQRRERHGRH